MKRLAVVLLMLWPDAADAQTPAPQEFQVRPAPSAIVLDGRLEEPGWQQAAPIRLPFVVALCTAVFAVCWIATARATIDAHKTTYLTFSHAVALPGVSLGAGTYIFEIANPDTGADVVRVMSRDRSTAYFMGFTRSIARLHRAGGERSLP